jgi:galactan 5-O-arabinofuranosyltransferase
MDFPITIETLTVAALAKFILLFAILGAAWATRRRAGPLPYLLLASAAFAAFYAVLAVPLARMWWGISGDEAFVGADLARNLAGGFGRDFYYAWLPPFYPPLYFWVTGALGGLLKLTAVDAAKLGVLLTLAAWFPLAYRLSRRFSIQLEDAGDTTVKQPWFWALPPLLLAVTLDFDTLITKPYETLPALLCAVWIGWLAARLRDTRWSWRTYLLFGLVGGVLFLTYYFWWFILAPAALAITLAAPNRLRSLVRLLGVSGIILAASLPYTLPLVLSLVKHGVESWQAVYTVPADFATFSPWAGNGLRSLLCASGLVSVAVFWRRPLVRGLGIGIIAAYGYQILSLVLFLAGRKPMQSAKPFLFLGSALLMTALAYGLIEAAAWLKTKRPNVLVPAAWALALLLLPLTPMVKFIDDPVVLRQIEVNKKRPAAKNLAKKISAAVPDWASRAWLTSGNPELNLYLPLSHFIAYNPHFSHPAVGYTSRLDYVETMLAAASAEEFARLADATEPPIDGLILFRDKKAGTYPLFFWQDDYPNGGKELRLDLRSELVSPDDWVTTYTDGDWTVLVRR